MSGSTQTIHIVPHTHWDREWYQPFQTFRVKLVDLCDELLELAEADPDFRFLLDGQTVVIEDYLAIRPGARTRLDRAIRRGQIQVGPWYTLPDAFLVSGETLVRNLERGIALGDAHGGAMRIGYLPDSFGHAAQMPQLYRHFGLTHAVVWRGVPSTIDRTAFDWEAPDGSRIPTAYLATSYSHGIRLPLDAAALAARLRTAAAALEPFRPGPHVLLMNGSDHLTPSGDLSRAVSAANLELTGLQARISRLDDYVRLLTPNGNRPGWTGELRASSRASILRGTLSARAPDKQAYFRATLTLERRAEPLAALSGIDAGGFLAQAWTHILHNAAHDTACGSVADRVADEARLRTRAAQQIADAVAERGLARLAQAIAPSSPDGAGVIDLLVWNPSPFPRAGAVEIDLPAADSAWVAESSQEILPTQPLAGLEPDEAPLSFAVQDVVGVQATLDPRRVPGEVIRNVGFQRDGPMVTVRVQVAPGGPGIDLDEARTQAERLAAEPGVARFEVQRLRHATQRMLVPTGPLEGCSVSRLVVRPGRPSKIGGAVRAAAGVLENDRLVCRVTGDGTLDVHDVKTDTHYAGLHRLVDDADAGDAYNFSPLAGEATVASPPAILSVATLESGPLRGVLEVRLLYRNPSELTPDRQHRSGELVDLPAALRISLSADSPQLDFDLELRNQARDHRLRVHFPLPYRVTHSDADGPFHVARRPALPPRHERGAPEWELPTHPLWTFVDASDGQRGLALIPEGLHEYELIPQPTPTLALTLLRAVGWLSRDDLAYRVGHAGPALETPDAQVLGPHRFRYSLRFHAGDWEAAGLWRAAEATRLPLEVAGLRLARSRPMRSPARIDLRPQTVQMTACVPRPYGYDLRLLNASNHGTAARVQLAPAPSQVLSIARRGDVLHPVAAQRGAYQLDLRPWEFASLRAVL